MEIGIENEILYKMQNDLSPQQLQKLKDIMLIALYPHEDNNAETIDENDNEKIINMYWVSLKISGRSENTIKRYALDIKNLLKFFNNKSVLDFTANDIRYYLAWYKDERKVSNTTLENMRLSFNSFFRWLEIEEYIDKNPMRKIFTIKCDTQKEEIFTQDEIEKLKFGVTNLRDRAIITFLASTGCRISEMCDTNISDVNFVEKEVLVHGKGNKDRIVPIDNIALYHLKEYLNSRADDNEALFVTLKGEPNRVKRNSIERSFARLGVKLNVKNVHPHKFRSTRITDLLVKNMSIQLVQQIAGHSNINTTQRYYRGDISLVKNEFMRLS